MTDFMKIRGMEEDMAENRHLWRLGVDGRLGNYLSSSFLIENGLKQGDALSPLLFNFSLEYAIRKVQETNLGLDMNGTHQVLAYADDVNLIGDDIKTIERNAQVLLNASKILV